MSAPPFMPFYVADYLGDTRHLTTEQHGAYLLLLMAMWRSGGRLADDGEQLARIAGLSARRWARTGAPVLALFTRQDDALTHKRILRERENYSETIAKRTAASALGVKARALKSQASGQPHGRPLVHQPEPQPQPDSEAVASERREKAHDRPHPKRELYARRLADIDAAMADAVERSGG